MSGPVSREPRLVLSLRAWLLVSHVFVLVLPVLVLVGSGALSDELRQQTRDDLSKQATLIGLLASHELRHARESVPNADLADIAEELGPSLVAVRNATLAGVRLLDARGVVVASSGSELGEDFSARPEVADALQGALAEAIRPRPSMSRRQPLSSESRHARVRLFIAAPVTIGDELIGVVVLSRTPREELQALYQMIPAWGAALALLVTIGIASWSGFMGTRSLVRLAGTARHIAGGALSGLGELARPERSHVREVAALAAAVSAMSARLQARLAYIGEFAGNVSHEFKTPISTLRGTVELLRDDEQMPPEQRARFLDNALKDLDRMERLVSGLLALARAEQAQGRRVVAVDEVIDAVVARFPGVERSGAAATVQGNPAQLETVLDNLVANAIRYGAEPVRIVAWHEADRTGFDVLDAGPGISEANLPRIFDRFFTTDRVGGTGLGLALVRAIVEAHGGMVEVESGPGRTRFRVGLPRG